MADRVGTGVTGSGPGAGTSIAASAKSTTTGNLLVVHVKWENAGVARTTISISDTASNVYTIIANLQNSTTSEPGTCLAYAQNITGNASNVVTATLSGSADFRNIIVEEFSGIDPTSTEDGNEQTNKASTGTTYSTADITTTGSGLVVIGVGIFAGLSTVSGTPGNPDFTVGAQSGESVIGYLISGSAQTVTPGLSSVPTGSAQWNAIAQAFLDIAGRFAARGPFRTGF